LISGARSLCWNGLRGHNRHKNMLDCNFSPNYGCFMNKDRLYNGASIICRRTRTSNNKRKGKPLKPKIQILSLGLAALLLAMPTASLFAAPPHTGIRGQAFIYQPGFAVEVSPGVWLGDGGFTYPTPTSFTVHMAHSGRMGHFSTDTGSSFQVSLPPGKYVVVPDTRFGLAAMPDSFEVTVRARHYTDVFIYYEPSPISFTPASP